MPASMARKKLSATLRNRERLCAEYQRGRCRRGDDCEFRHSCACLVQSGRVCGGRHPAIECRAKRVLAASPAREPRYAVFQRQHGGQLWLGGLPTRATVRHFPKAELQVCCMAESPEAPGSYFAGRPLAAGARLLSQPPG